MSLATDLANGAEKYVAGSAQWPYPCSLFTESGIDGAHTCTIVKSIRVLRSDLAY